VEDLKTTRAKGAISATKIRTKTKPELPKDAPVCNLVSNKNFIVANAVETILAQPKKVGAEGQDYLKKEDYGKVPAYLQRIKQDIAAEYEYIKKLQQEQEEQQKQQVRLMSVEEREELVNGLKAKWESVNQEYQMHTHLTKLDTIGKIKRKERCETMLDQLEKDLQKLKKQHIYVDTRQ
jgi:predicted transcriptional regulator